MTQNEMEIQLEEEVKGLTQYLDSDDYRNACDDAELETGWTFPITTSFRLFWIKQRAKRHLFFYLLSEQAHKFKFEQINLQHRFDHYFKIMEKMDEDFAAIQESRPDEFADVSVINLFGTKVDAGFSYDGVGNDTTYNSDQEVIFSPTEND